MSAIESFIAAWGSVRLRNCFRQAIAGGRMPYETLGDYFSDRVDVRLNRMTLVRGMGNKTAKEFDELLLKLQMSTDVMVDEGDKASVPVSLTQRPVSCAAKPMQLEPVQPEPSFRPKPSLDDRYWCLTPREKQIIVRRFGIDRDCKQTLEEVGKVYDLTRERIRQLESRAIKKMRFPLTAPSWGLFIQIYFDQLMDAVFGGQKLIKEPCRISGEYALAIKICYGSSVRFLEEKAQRLDEYWLTPSLNVLDVQTTRNRIRACVKEPGSLPLSVGEVAIAFGVSGAVVEAAVLALEGQQIYKGWIIEGNPTSRKRRSVNILNLFHERQIESPVSVWNMKVAYWANYNDRCSGRDLLICLADQKAHFVNLRELGWMCFSTDRDGAPRNSVHPESSRRVPEELYEKPVKSDRGLLNCVYEIFKIHGPQRLSDAAELFQKNYPQYKLTSMYPTLVCHAVFLKLSPGIIGLQTHLRDPDAIRSAREIMLRTNDLDLYLVSRAAGAPVPRYPLWDLEMEQRWACWLVEIEDMRRLGILLSVAKISEWNVSEPERMAWETRKGEIGGRVDAPPIRIFSERRIDAEMLTTALAASSVSGCVNWMYLNQALGWRIETTRVGLVLAVLIWIGALKPTGAWTQSHVLTRRGRDMFLSICHRPNLLTPDARKVMMDFLEDRIEAKAEAGWAAEYEFDQLLNQITGISNDQPDGADALDQEENDIAAAYEGVMADELLRLIEADE
jgi:hypothetical protein